MGESVCFSTHCLAVFQSGSTNTYPISSDRRTILVHLPPPALGIFILYILATSAGVQRFHIVALISISLMTNETEHSVMVYWPFVCMCFSFMEMGIVVIFILVLIFLPRHSAFELYPCGV